MLQQYGVLVFPFCFPSPSCTSLSPVANRGSSRCSLAWSCYSLRPVPSGGPGQVTVYFRVSGISKSVVCTPDSKHDFRLFWGGHVDVAVWALQVMFPSKVRLLGGLQQIFWCPRWQPLVGMSMGPLFSALLLVFMAFVRTQNLCLSSLVRICQWIQKLLGKGIDRRMQTHPQKTWQQSSDCSRKHG